MFALLRQGEFRVGAGDTVAQYLLAVNGHDGSRALSFLPTDVRVVCANTLRMAEGSARATVRMLHTSGLPERIKAASGALEHAEALVSIQREQSRELGERQWSESTRMLYLARTVEDVRGLTPGTLVVDRPSGGLRVHSVGEERTDRDELSRALDIASSIVAAERHRFQELAPEGSAWRSFQAVSHWAHHVRKGRQDAVETRLTGAVSSIVSRAFNRALALK
jgi:hypothetical protein